jgi:hypothetical protein
MRSLRIFLDVITTASIASFVTTRGWLDDDQVWPKLY